MTSYNDPASIVVIDRILKQLEADARIRVPPTRSRDKQQNLHNDDQPHPGLAAYVQKLKTETPPE